MGRYRSTYQQRRERMRAIADAYVNHPEMRVKDIAEEFGVTPGTVNYACKQCGVPNRHPDLSAAMKRRYSEKKA